MVINISQSQSKLWPAMVRRLLKLEFLEKTGIGFFRPMTYTGERGILLIDTKENILAFLSLVEEEISTNMQKLSAQITLMNDIQNLIQRAKQLE